MDSLSSNLRIYCFFLHDDDDEGHTDTQKKVLGTFVGTFVPFSKATHCPRQTLIVAIPPCLLRTACEDTRKGGNATPRRDEKKKLHNGLLLELQPDQGNEPGTHKHVSPCYCVWWLAATPRRTTELATRATAVIGPPCKSRRPSK